MKKRNLVITAFLLCATLVIGIGYAAVGSDLLVSGGATFNGYKIVEGGVIDSVKFVNAQALTKTCTNAAVTGATGALADMAVLFNDDDGTAQTFTAQALYTIKYDTAIKTLPAVTLGDPTETVTANTEGYNITTVYQATAAGEGVVAGEISGATAVLDPGESVDVLVTVEFNNNATGSVYQEQLIGQISVKIPFLSVE